MYDASPTYVSSDLLTPNLAIKDRRYLGRKTENAILGKDKQRSTSNDTNNINYKLMQIQMNMIRLLPAYPVNNPYFTHMSKFALFPHYKPIFTQLPMATTTLHQLLTKYYCSTSYKDNYKMEISKKDIESERDDDNENEIPPISVESIKPFIDWSTFKQYAHTRFNNCHWEPTPNLYDNNKVGKRTLFYGFHSSVLRGLSL